MIKLKQCLLTFTSIWRESVKSFEAWIAIKTTNSRLTITLAGVSVTTEIHTTNCVTRAILTSIARFKIPKAFGAFIASAAGYIFTTDTLSILLITRLLNGAQWVAMALYTHTHTKKNNNNINRFIYL